MGIDLGTTHTVVAYAPVPTARGRGSAAAASALPQSPQQSLRQSLQLFDIPQWVAAGEWAAQPLLPSVRYHPAPGELATQHSGGEREVGGEAGFVVGTWARQLGAQVPGRLVSSAKSWLSHAGVDRLAPLLPWGAQEVNDPGLLKVSPVQASASYLAHVRMAWNQQHPDAPLEAQTVVLTLPASFDEVARKLTVQAAQEAGLPQLTLLEEPQAAFQDWLWQHQDSLGEALAGVQRVLVCDVGGGTCDFTLIDVEANVAAPAGLKAKGRKTGETAAALPRLHRCRVGQHLMLGGDNMDLALAQAVEQQLGGAGVQQLSSARLAQLVARCRVAKETLLADDTQAPEQFTLTLLGGGSRLVGGTRSVSLSRAAVRAQLVEGFFPRVSLHEGARRSRAALHSLGLPYASDAAVTRHLATFLQPHVAAGEALPDAVVLNGGVFRSPVLVQRVLDTLADWRGGEAPRHLALDNPDVAVARGAVAHGLARLGHSVRIRAGAARSVWLLLDEVAGQPADADGASTRAVCLLPRGSEPGVTQGLPERVFALRVGQPVRFWLATPEAETGEPPALGEVRTLALATLQRLPPIATVVADTVAEGESATSGQTGQTGKTGRRQVQVHVETTLTEVGTLDVQCVAVDNAAARWQLEFQVRTPSLRTPSSAGAHGDEGDAAGDVAGEASTPADTAAKAIAPRWGEALAHIERVFGARSAKPAPREVRQLRAQLESVLGRREQWSRVLARRLFDELWLRARARRRSAEHERAWFNLAGWCLRPGFGDPLDAWRLEQLWALYEPGAEHRLDVQVASQWWTMWRRVAAGLPEAAQCRLLDDFGYNLQSLEHPGAALPPRPAGLVRGGHDDMVRLGAVLERVPAEHKTEVGEWLLQPWRVTPPGHPQGELRLWALGRLGARQPVHGSVHTVVPVDTAEAWLAVLLGCDWRRERMAAFAAAQLARRTGDRARDVSEPWREQVLARLRQIGAAPSWVQMVEEVLALEALDQQALFGESLPPGLVLVD